MVTKVVMYSAQSLDLITPKTERKEMAIKKPVGNCARQCLRHPAASLLRNSTIGLGVCAFNNLGNVSVQLFG